MAEKQRGVLKRGAVLSRIMTWKQVLKRGRHDRVSHSVPEWEFQETSSAQREAEFFKRERRRSIAYTNQSQIAVGQPAGQQSHGASGAVEGAGGEEMSEFFLKIGRFVVSLSVGPQDSADRLNYKITPILLLMASAVLTLRLYVFKPIQCWVPAEFRDSWEEYAENYCYIQNTYYIPLEQPLPECERTSVNECIERKVKQIGYYQWVPLVLGVQGFILLLPSIMWKWLSKRVGVDLDALLQCAQEAHSANSESREKSVTYVARYLEDALFRQRERLRRQIASSKLKHTQNFCCALGRSGGNYLAIIYLGVKVLCVLNCFGQLVLIAKFTGTNYTLYGYGMLNDLVNSREWQESGLFPRVTWCDFNVRTVGSLVRYSVQCVLPINMLHEKLYIYLWFWFVFLMCVASFSFTAWIWRVCFPRNRRMYTCRYLKLMNMLSPGDKKLVVRFTDLYLCHDGVFLLYMIGDAAGELVAGEVISYLWTRFKRSAGLLPGAKNSLFGMQHSNSNNNNVLTTEDIIRTVNAETGKETVLVMREPHVRAHVH